MARPGDDGLVEREAALGTLREALAGARAGSGALVFVAGESGAGKTSVVDAFAATAGCRVHRGACDPLSSPAPLAPFADLACGDALQATLARACTPHEVFAALRDDLAAEPSVVVIEDAHWADEATLDVLRVLGRRVEALPLLAIVTYRTVPESRPLRIVLGDLASRRAVVRVAVEPLSPAAVRALAAGRDIDPDDLHRRTAGNAFLVRELLRDTAGGVPATVRDAILARTARLDADARHLLELVACSPLPVERWLLDGLGVAPFAVPADGLLVATDDGVAFGHEIAREAILAEIPPARRRELHQAILACLGASPQPLEPARLAHHAEEAGDAEAAVAFATAAAERAAAVGAHREAADQLGRALRCGRLLSLPARAALLERRAAEHFAADEQLASIADLEEAVALHRACGDGAREADALAQLVPRLSCRGRVGEATATAAAAVALRPDAPQPLAALAHLELVEDRLVDAARVGERARAVALAERDDLVAGDAAITAGMARALLVGAPAFAQLESALAFGRERGLEALLPRALNDLALAAIVWREHAAAERWLAEALAHVDGHDLDLWRLAILAARMRSLLDQGRWGAAADLARQLLDDERDSPGPRAEAHAVLALLRARRGDPGSSEAFAESARLQSEPTWQIEVATGRAEAAWLDGRHAAIAAVTDDAFALAGDRDAPWPYAGLALWRHRAGLAVRVDRSLPRPITLELDGRHEAAAGAWSELGCPYEEALSRMLGEEPEPILAAHARLLELGASAAARIAARRLRERGVRRIPRGPQPTTRANAAHLTRREQDVLRLVADGLSNPQIAGRLYLSPRTVDFHVSALLRKLEATTRGEAVAAARRHDLLRSR